MSEERFEGRFFSCREMGVSHGVMFCHDASPQRQELPAGSRAQKWLKNWFFRNEKVGVLLVKSCDRN